MESRINVLLLGVFILLGLFSLGYWHYQAAIDVKNFERTVTVKGLSEKEFPADIVIWPISFSLADNNLQKLYQTMESNTNTIQQFLKDRGVAAEEITLAPPAITDKSAQQYGNNRAPFRYTATQTVTVYTSKVAEVRQLMTELSQLGKQGIVINRENYDARTQYLFTSLNKIKPEMIEQSTRKAREVALKFAEDSESSLGKIKSARQGQFSISARDKNNPHIKKVRVVSTVVYFLSD